jgi:hypothetical protein
MDLICQHIIIHCYVFHFFLFFLTMYFSLRIFFLLRIFHYVVIVAIYVTSQYFI